jgi:hypothetical protein
MTYSVSGNLHGRWEILQADTAQQAEEQTEKLHKLGVMPVHIKKDGVLITTSAHFEQLLQAEAQAANAQGPKGEP